MVAKKIWISRDKKPYFGYSKVYLWNKRPLPIKYGEDIIYQNPKNSYAQELDYDLFKMIIGISLKPGQCKQVVLKEVKECQ